MNRFVGTVIIFVVCSQCLVFQARAFIDAALQMPLGNPSGAIADTNNHAHYLVQRAVEALDYSDNLGEPVWASWDLTAGDVGSATRSTIFFTDTNLPPNFYRVTSGDYDGDSLVGINRGHLCPSEDRTDTEADNDAVFFMSNIMAQNGTNNSGVWGTFEGYCRSLLANNELLIICGPSGFGTNRIPSGKAVIADNTWKIVVVVPTNSGAALSRITSITNRVIALKISNTNSATKTWTNYVTSAHQIELDTGFNFFTALPATIASAFRAKIDNLGTPPPPAIVSFTPTSGLSNVGVVISGTNFNGASIVAFNGVNSAFYVDSNMQITAIVPTNATSGVISVATPGGTATSSGSFAVTGLSTVDLDIAASHAGNFTQGDTGAIYTLTVTNVGSLASTGTVSVVNTLPVGLTATAINGSGWTTNLATLTCTRSDALSAGAGYPPIFVTVSVATNAPAIVTNAAVVSGGGDAIANMATDPTIINPASTGGTVYTGILIGWDVSGQIDYGPSTLAQVTNAPNLTVTGLTRGVGVGTSGTGAANGWGGTGFTNLTATTAIAYNQFVTFTLAANAGYRVSYSSFSRFDYRRSSTGPTNGVLQYQIGAGVFTDITNLNYSSTNNNGAAIGAIDLTGFASLQNVGPNTNVTFRIVNYAGTASGGKWYVYDMGGSTAPDLAIQGTVTQVVLTTNAPAIAPMLTLIAFTKQQFHFTVSGTAGSNYVVQATTNLNPANWIPLITNAAPFLFIESNPLPQRFYRSLVLP